MEQKIKDFVNKNNGKFIEVVDSNALYQCFDLADAWLQYLGIPLESIAHYYAYQIYTQPSQMTKTYFDLIPNSPTTFVQPGDVVVFGQALGVAGHVSIATRNIDQNTFESFDQNWGDPKYSRLIIHNYDMDNVLGWLRAKLTVNTGVQVSDQLMKEYLADKAYVDALKSFNTYYEVADRVITDLKTIQPLKDQINKANADRNLAQAQQDALIQKSKVALADANKLVTELTSFVS